MSRKNTKRIRPPKEKGAKKERTPRLWKQTLGDIFRRKTTLGIIALVVPLLVIFLVQPLWNNFISEERVQVVRVAQYVAKGSALTADALTLGEISRQDLPQGAMTSLQQAAGRYAGTDLMPGDIVTDAKSTLDFPMANSYLYDLPEGKSAMSVNVQGLAEGLSGKLKPGDIVTLYAAVHLSDVEDDYLALQPPELRYVKVLAVSDSTGADIDVDAHLLQGDTDLQGLPATLTLLVGGQQGEGGGLDANATIYAALSSRGNDAYAAAYLEAQEVYLLQQEEDEPELEADAAETQSALPSPADVPEEGQDSGADIEDSDEEVVEP